MYYLLFAIDDRDCIIFQCQAFANTLTALANYVDDLGELAQRLKYIANKHVSFDIPRSYYSIYRTELMAAFQEVLGNDATDEFIDAWTDVYNALTKVLQSLEDNIKGAKKDEAGMYTKLGFLKFLKKNSI